MCPAAFSNNIERVAHLSTQLNPARQPVVPRMKYSIDYEHRNLLERKKSLEHAMTRYPYFLVMRHSFSYEFMKRKSRS